jgi:hypothetical protein
VSVAVNTYAPVGDPVPLVLTEGRPPAGPDEVVLAPASASRLGTGTGSTLRLAGDRAARNLRVTGLGFAVQTSTAGYDTGAWVTGAGYDLLFDGFKEHGALLALRPGVDPFSIVPRLKAAAGDSLLLIPPYLPPQFGEIRNVRALPTALGAFLAVLAVGAVGHALVTAARRRAHDLAVLRALGMTRARSRTVLRTQAVVITAFGLLAGVPLGHALGQALWRTVAAIMPLWYHPPVSGWTLALVTPLALLAAVLLAALPGRHAARLHLGRALRAE